MGKQSRLYEKGVAMENNIILIGFMGTGKSTVGLRLAQKLKMDFVDMDKEIERVTGLPVHELFRRYGEIRFRSEEKLMARKLAQRANQVIATGGGVVLQMENIDVLHRSGTIICLEAAPEDILERVNRKKGSRPLMKKGAGLEDVKALLESRRTLYSCADMRVNTSGRGVEQVVEDICRFLKDKHTATEYKQTFLQDLS